MESLFPNQDVRQLIADAREGRKESLDQICRGLLPAVARMCHSLFPDYLLAKTGESDLVQEAMLGASQNFSCFQGQHEADLLGWVRVIVENKSMDLKRRYHAAEMRDISRERPLAAEASSRLDILLADSSQSPLAKLITADEAARVRQLVLELPDHYQAVVRLRHADGLSFPEIAAHLNRTEPSVKNLYVRALEILEQGLSD